MEIRQHLNVQGTVQGVGFRYRAKHMADALALTGTVKNLPDGSVELEVQGEESVVAEYLDRLCNSTSVQVAAVKFKECSVHTENSYEILMNEEQT